MKRQKTGPRSGQMSPRARDPSICTQDATIEGGPTQRLPHADVPKICLKKSGRYCSEARLVSTMSVAAQVLCDRGAST